MSGINKKKPIDPMAEARKDRRFSDYAKAAAARIKLGVEIYNTRTTKNMSQQELAKITKTTQKMISNIENGSVDVRYSTLNKIKEALSFQAENWCRIHNFPMPYKFYWVGGNVNKQNNKNANNKITALATSNATPLN